MSRADMEDGLELFAVVIVLLSGIASLGGLVCAIVASGGAA